jgi:hypothetical protein
VRPAALALGALIGALLLPATASALPRFYHGTLEIDQKPQQVTLPENSSVTYTFHARYAVTARLARKDPQSPSRYYSFQGAGNQSFAYTANLHKTTSAGTNDYVADWHGHGRWTRRSGQVLILFRAGRNFAVDVDLNFRPKTIPLSVTSDETDVSTTEDGTCVLRLGMHGATAFRDDPCSSDTSSTTVPHGMAVNPYNLLDDRDPRYRNCRGLKRSQRLFNGFCGVTKPSGRIHMTHTNVWEHELDFPFAPWRDDDAAFDPNYGYPFAGGTWGPFAIVTRIAVDLKPGR